MNDRNRSIPLHVLSSILDLDATFVSLQKDPRPDDKAVLLERAEIVDLTAHLTDFVETAALISCLDLVITVDTSVAHLAAALGRPTWILLPHTPDYRWLLDREDSPWYPAVRLFRQSKTRDYGEVLDRVYDEGLVFVNTHGQLLTKGQRLEDLRSGNLKFMSFGRDDYQLHIYGDTVVLNGRANSVVQFHGKVNRIPRKFTLTYIKLNGAWRLVMR